MFEANLLVVCAFATMVYFGLEIYYRKVWRRRLIENRSFYSLCVYSDTLVPGIFDRLLGTHAEVSRVGFFKENRDFVLTVFGYEAEIIRQTHFRTNNCGLLTPRNYVVERGSSEFRIVVIGDEQTASTTAEICWPDLLENELNSNRRLVEETGRKEFKVFNLGWPDAGLSHFAEIAEANAKRFDPDLVIVNLTAHSYERYRQGLPSTLHGKHYQGKPITYSVGDGPGETAYLLALCIREPATLKSLHCTASPPFNFYMSAELTGQQEKVWRIMQKVVVDFVGGTIFHDWRPFILCRLFDSKFDPLARRRIQIPQPSAMHDQEICDQAVVQLGKIGSAHRKVIFVRNVTGYPDLFPAPADDPITSAVCEVSSNLDITMMKDRMVQEESVEEIRSWYLPDDLSKWSPKGHAVYAKAVARLVDERLCGDPKTNMSHRSN